MIEPSLLRHLFSYDAATGRLYWLTRPREMFSSDQAWRGWNARFAGEEAGGVDDKGYRRMSIFGISHKAHRVAWAVHHGAWPKQEIDHINGDRLDNRLANLRDCSRSVNQRNRRMAINNSSGVNGVSLDNATERWRAQIKLNGKQTHLGLFATIEEAAAAWAAATAGQGYTERHGR